jgi:hypothetical protein
MKCRTSSCLGHADERSAEVRCIECHGTRYVLVRPPSAPDPSYTCTRCRASAPQRHDVSGEGA